MTTQSRDTRTGSERVLISLLRGKSVAENFAQLRSLSQTVIQLSKRAIARANKGLSVQQINILFMELHYGKELALKVKSCLGNKHGKS